MTAKPNLPPGVRGAIAAARAALIAAKEREPAPAKDRDQLVADVDAWREETFIESEAAPSTPERFV